MIGVATGGPRIQAVQRDFAQLFDEVTGELSQREIKNALPYRDLWEWYGRWSSGDMSPYQSRRNSVTSLFGDLVKRIQTERKEEFEPTGWDR
jgi:hypothetical protein